MLLTATEAATRRCQEGFAASDGVNLNGYASCGGAGGGMPVHTAVYAGDTGSGMMSVVARQGPSAPYNCIGPQCMAWRFNEKRTQDGAFLGYCGKAGRID